MHWPFAKYVGCGNDFILFDNRQQQFPYDQADLIIQLCDRHQGIGADGIILLELSKVADCRLRIFNADGSEAEMCGNGARCFVKWLKTLGFSQSSFRIETMHRVLQAHLIEDQVQIKMGSPSAIQWNIPFSFEDESFQVHYLDTGVPHVLMFVEEIDDLDLNTLGPYVRYHSLWAPKGTNLTLVEQMSGSHLKIRTYERGVEGETLACGTGATAAALGMAHQRHLKGPLTVETRSGEHLVIDFNSHEETFSSVTMTGPARCVFQGRIELAATVTVDSHLTYSVIF